MPHANNESNDSNKTEYAQLVASVVNQYDASLIFYQVKPVQSNKDDIQKFKPSTEEVARITMPHRALKELSNLLLEQTKNIKVEKVKTGENKTIANLKKKK